MENLPPTVLEAFNCAGDPKPLQGGEGRSFLAGDVVFKPVRAEDHARHAWASEVLCGMQCAGFRISMPLKTAAGQFIHAGWSASRYEHGEAIQGRWDEKLTTCRAFHRALHALSISPMPFTANHWAQAHRIAWQENDLPQFIHPDIGQMIARIFERYEPMVRSTQVVHSDLCGNILFAERLAPLVIDFSPAHGVTEYAEAILVADAIAWEKAPVELVQALPRTFDYRQMLLRAVNFRVITAALFFPTQPEIVRLEQVNFSPLLRALE